MNVAFDKNGDQGLFSIFNSMDQFQTRNYIINSFKDREENNLTTLLIHYQYSYLNTKFLQLKIISVEEIY